jgi:hypothetical protein
MNVCFVILIRIHLVVKYQVNSGVVYDKNFRQVASICDARRVDGDLQQPLTKQTNLGFKTAFKKP